MYRGLFLGSILRAGFVDQHSHSYLFAIMDPFVEAQDLITVNAVNSGEFSDISTNLIQRTPDFI